MAVIVAAVADVMMIGNYHHGMLIIVYGTQPLSTPQTAPILPSLRQIGRHTGPAQLIGTPRRDANDKEDQAQDPIQHRMLRDESNENPRGHTGCRQGNAHVRGIATPRNDTGPEFVAQTFRGHHEQPRGPPLSRCVSQRLPMLPYLL